MKIYFDKFSNMATITTKKMLPYEGTRVRQQSFVLKVYALYDKNFLYFLSVYETEAEALKKLSEFSCGTFKREKGGKYASIK